MKYRENASEPFQELYIKALDSMPVGTIVDYDGTSANVPVGWEIDTTLDIRISEKGQVIASDFTDYTFGSATYSYYHVDFTKTYTNMPIVIINGVDISSKNYWGTLDQFFIKDLTNTGMNIVMNRPKNEPSGSSSKVYVNYIVISND